MMRSRGPGPMELRVSAKGREMVQLRHGVSDVRALAGDVPGVSLGPSITTRTDSDVPASVRRGNSHGKIQADNWYSDLL